LNALRSPMAEGLFKHLHNRRVFVDSVGVRAGELDSFAVAVMDEIGIDISRHRAKSFDNLEDTSFDLIVSLSPEAHHRALEMTRTMACEVELWNTFDPSIIEGGREVRLDAYRGVRDALMRRIRDRFPIRAAPTV
jgi:protein-tyrosine-phosphatase